MVNLDINMDLKIWILVMDNCFANGPNELWLKSGLLLLWIWMEFG